MPVRTAGESLARLICYAGLVKSVEKIRYDLYCTARYFSVRVLYIGRF